MEVIGEGLVEIEEYGEWDGWEWNEEWESDVKEIMWVDEGGIGDGRGEGGKRWIRKG